MSFGLLTPIYRTKNNGQKVCWVCQCECGNYVKVQKDNLISGHTQSCGCLKGHLSLDKPGDKFGHWTLIKRQGNYSNGEALWLVECDCENHTQKVIRSLYLHNGESSSCGCDKSSKGEKEISTLLRQANIPFETQYKLFMYQSGRPARFDFFVNNEYMIEFDGLQHYKMRSQFQKSESDFQHQQELDRIKNNYCLKNDIPLIRIPYWKLKTLSINDLLLESSKYIVKEHKDNAE